MTTTSTPAACKLLHAACSYVQRVMHARTQLLFGSLWLVSRGQLGRARMLVPPISSCEGALGVRAPFGFPCFTAMRGPALSPLCSSSRACTQDGTEWC